MPVAKDATRWPRTALAVLATVFALNLFARGSGETYAVFLLPLEREFGWSRSQLTSVYALYLVVGAVLAPLVGLLFDRLGPRVVYTAGLCCLSAAFLLAGTLSELWQFYVYVGVLIGVGVALNGMVPASALLSRWYRARLSTAIGIAFAAMGCGSLVFVPLSQGLIGYVDWRGTYRVLGLALLAIVPLVVFAVPWKRYVLGNPDYRAGVRARDGRGGSTLAAALHTRLYWGLVAIFFFTSVGMYTVLPQSVVYFIDSGFSPLTAATAYGITGMLSVASVSSSGLLAERFGYRQTVTVSFVGSGLGIATLFALSFAAHGALLATYVLVFGLCMGVRGPIISSICTREFSGPQVATIYGALYSTNALGAAVGSMTGGVLHDLTGGYRAGFVFALCSILLAALPMWLVRGLRAFK
jgi:MFS family permease